MVFTYLFQFNNSNHLFALGIWFQVFLSNTNNFKTDPFDSWMGP